MPVNGENQNEAVVNCPVYYWRNCCLEWTCFCAKLVELMGAVYGVAFEEIGPLDYSQRDDIEEIQNAAIGFFKSSDDSTVIVAFV